MKVLYDEVVVGTYVADLVVEDSVLVEIKAVKLLDEIHSAQCLNYFESDGSATLPFDQLRTDPSRHQTLDTDDGYEALTTIRAQAYDNVLACLRPYCLSLFFLSGSIGVHPRFNHPSTPRNFADVPE
jgi:hypothetical protein